eukprot:6737558-Pyramimonas_sp.AAC.1
MPDSYLPCRGNGVPAELDGAIGDRPPSSVESGRRSCGLDEWGPWCMGIVRPRLRVPSSNCRRSWRCSGVVGWGPPA